MLCHCRINMTRHIFLVNDKTQRDTKRHKKLELMQNLKKIIKKMWSCRDSNSQQGKCYALTPEAIPLRLVIYSRNCPGIDLELFLQILLYFSLAGAADPGGLGGRTPLELGIYKVNSGISVCPAPFIVFRPP